jgi:hypothetical protein
MGIPMSQVIIDVSASGQSGFQGSWGHILVAMDLSSWVSVPFQLWSNKVLLAVIHNDFEALTEDAKQAQEHLQKIWNELRDCTKETFWFMTDAIRDYYDRNPRVERYQGQNYAEAFDTLNVKLFGRHSVQIKEELGICKNKLNRDHFGRESLK